MTKAAKKLFIAQPSLSQSIRSLENEIGIELFDRSKTPLQSTAAGELFIEWARNMLISHQRIHRKIADISCNQRRKLVIGVSPQWSAEILTAALKRFYSEVSGCTVVLREYNPEMASALLDSDDIDLSIGKPIINETKYINIPILKDKILVAAPDSYRFDHNNDGEYPSISVHSLVGIPYIAFDVTGHISDWSRNIFLSSGELPYPVMECGSIKMAHSMVSCGIGFTFVTELIIKNNKLPNVCYYTLNSMQISNTIALYYRKDRYQTADAKEFTRILQESYSIPIQIQ